MEDQLPAWWTQGRHDVYSMVVPGFATRTSRACTSWRWLLYVHLSHGIGSVFQSLGLNTPRSQPFVRRFCRGRRSVALANVGIVVLVWAG